MPSRAFYRDELRRLKKQNEQLIERLKETTKELAHHGRWCDGRRPSRFMSFIQIGRAHV